jgi:hypothetical protein
LVGAGVSSNGRRSVNANAGLRHGERTKDLLRNNQFSF